MLTDEREATPHVEEFCYEGGIIDFVKFLNDGKDVPEAFKEPIYIEGKSDPDAPVTKMGEVEVSLQWNAGYGENEMCIRDRWPYGHGSHGSWHAYAY